jgi:hypothetical protein
MKINNQYLVDENKLDILRAYLDSASELEASLTFSDHLVGTKITLPGKLLTYNLTTEHNISDAFNQIRKDKEKIPLSSINKLQATRNIPKTVNTCAEMLFEHPLSEQFAFSVKYGLRPFHPMYKHEKNFLGLLGVISEVNNQIKKLTQISGAIFGRIPSKEIDKIYLSLNDLFKNQEREKFHSFTKSLFIQEGYRTPIEREYTNLSNNIEYKLFSNSLIYNVIKNEKKK